MHQSKNNTLKFTCYHPVFFSRNDFVVNTNAIRDVALKWNIFALCHVITYFPVASIGVNARVILVDVPNAWRLALKSCIVNVVVLFFILLYLVERNLLLVKSLVPGQEIVNITLIIIVIQALVLHVLFFAKNGATDIMSKDQLSCVTKIVSVADYRVERQCPVGDINVTNPAIMDLVQLFVINHAPLQEGCVAIYVESLVTIHRAPKVVVNKKYQ